MLTSHQPNMPFSETEQETISPHTLEPVLGTHRAYPTKQELEHIIHSADNAQRQWRDVSLKDRIKIGRKFVVRLFMLVVDLMENGAD
jgi:acyl-CoA reductase-like NAD-dependent aldehyde dehydrogenase